MNLRYMKFITIICAFVLLSCTGCVSLVEKAGRALDGSAFAEKQTAIYRTTGIEIREMKNKAGERSFIIALQKFPAMQIRGTDSGEAGEFILTSLDYLSGSANGWNEYRLELSGYGNLVLGETTAVISIPGEIEPVQISFGRIRRYDTRITGSEALTNLRHRRERILALTEWMNGQENAPHVDMTSVNSATTKKKALVKAAKKDRESFEEYWAPLLFPELASKKKRPADWQQEGDIWVRAEDIRWNSSYTERLFPEELKAIRDSGTMLRDWEEAIEWIYIEYEWPKITELLAQETVLPKVKK